MNNILIRMGGGVIFAYSMFFLGGPELGFKATIGIALLILGYQLSEYGIRKNI